MTMRISIGRPDFIPVTINSRALPASKGFAKSPISLEIIIGATAGVGVLVGVGVLL